MIYKEITDEYYFWNWLKNSDNYSNNFSLEGAKAVFNYFDELSEEVGLGEHPGIEFDPIAWCCEFSEYDSVDDAYDAYYSHDVELARELNLNTLEERLQKFQDNTTVIELDNGHIILGEF